MATLDFDATRPYKPNFTMPRGVPEFPDRLQIGANPPGAGLAVDNRPNFTMPSTPLPDGVVGEGPAAKGMNTAGATDATVKTPSSLRAGLGRIIDSGSTAFDAAKGAGSATFNAGKGASGAVFDAGKSVAGFGAKALKPALGIAGAVTGILPHASAYTDDNISLGDKFRLGGTDALRLGATAFGGALGAGAGSVVPVAGTIAGGIVGAGAGDHLGHKLGNAMFGSDDILRKSGRDPNRDIIDAAMNKDGQGFLGGGPGGKGPSPTAGGLPVQTTAGGLPVRTTASQADQMHNRSATYPGQSVAEQVAGEAGGVQAAAAAQPGVPANTLRGQAGTDMGGGISKFVQGGRTLYSNVQGGDNDALMNRGPTSAQNLRAMDGIQARQDQGDAAYAAKQKYNAEVADAQALRKGPTYINSAKIQTERRGQDILARGQDLNYDAAVQGHNQTRNSNIERLRYDMQKDKRDFDVGRSDNAAVRGDKAFEQRQQATKDLHTEIGNMLPPGADGKPDTARAAQYATGMNALLGDRQRELQTALKNDPGNPRAKEWQANLEHLATKGPAALDDATKQKYLAGMLAKDTATANHGVITPWSGKAVNTNSPVVSLRSKPGIIFDDYSAKHSDGSESVIPARAVDGGWFSPADKRLQSLK